MSGKYRILSCLGKGNSSEVFLAEHRKLKAYRAVKCISKSAHPMQPQLLLEADILKNLKHPGIPTIYDVEEDDKSYYRGLYNLQSRFSAGYFEEKYGLDKDEIIVVKQDNRVSVGRDEDLALYEELVSYVREADMSDPGTYREIDRRMDIQSFIDHYCFEIYIANTDWPLNNLCCWRSREESGTSEYEDGRWRWGVYDTDESTGIYEEAAAL